MTFWRYVPQDSKEASSAAVARSLAKMHLALGKIAPIIGVLRPFDDELHELLKLLGDPQFAWQLEPEARRLLQLSIDDGIARLRQRPLSPRVLHGSPHRLNILMLDGSPHFIDFETVCLGPREWDLAHLESAVAARYPEPVDVEALTTCRVLVSAKTAAWCWHSIHRGPDMRFHAEHHLGVVRRSRE